ncbi:MAG: ATPase, T2SS/T4P/T4SS family [Candidatus Sumerlaeaceae bacterium]|nr:ATPase, T2SS/T4P/T4SS family [Candidatus Sumerlaeaceae bacterium]
MSESRTTEGMALQERLEALRESDNWAVEAADLLLGAAFRSACSDLHLACVRDAVVVRGRRDGGFFALARIPAVRRDLLIARLKVLARVPAFIRHEPQDGRIEWQPPDAAGPILLRASFLPTIHGESIVIRFPEPSARLLDLGALGMSDAVLDAVEGLLARQEGTLMLTGPSSSGKTTTIYAMLSRLHERRGDRLNILTIEDPVERDLGFASQVQVSEPQGLTHERALRAALRQDPNVLMIGEVRDADTARVAIQAGMTGHLVISTLHAGRASRVFTRLLSMGVEPYLVASAMAGAVAQRLARRLCPACRRVEGAAAEWTAGGCAECDFTGHRGRRGLFEAVIVTEELRGLILARATSSQIAAQAAREQVGDLVAEGRRLADTGEISRAEFEYLLAGEEEEMTHEHA